MAQTIRLKRTSTTGNDWTDASLLSGEMALNTTDKRLWVGDVDNTSALEILTDASSINANATKIKVHANSAITKGKSVRYISYNSTNKAIAVVHGDNTVDVSVGIAEDDIASGQVGYVYSNGILNGLDTSAWSEGDILYVGTSGNLTSTEPTTGHAQPIGFVMRDHATNGKLMITVDYPKQQANDVRFDPSTSSLISTDVQTALKELSDNLSGAATLDGLTDTNIPSPVNGQVLSYDSATSKWIATSVAGAGSVRYDFSATAAQSIFTCAYDINSVEVFAMGVKLEDTEYLAINGTSITLNQPQELNTWVQIVSNLNLVSSPFIDWSLDQGATNIHQNNLVKALDSEKLDNLDSTQFLRSDISDSMSGTLTATAFSGPLTGDVTGTSSLVSVTNSTTAADYPVVWHNNSNRLYDTVAKFTFNPSTGNLITTTAAATTFTEGGTLLSSKYLGITAKASDSDKLDNLDSTQFLRSDVNDTFNGDLVVTGNFEVQGTTTYLDTENLRTVDANIELNYITGTTETDAQAHLGGITLHGTTDKTILWSNTTDSWEFNQPIVSTGNIKGATITSLGAISSGALTVTGAITATTTIAATGAVTGSNLSGTNTGDQSSGDFTHDALLGVDANEHLDWTASSVGAIHQTNFSISTKSIKHLSDVYTTMSPNQGDSLVYDTTNGWQSVDLLSSVPIQDLSDVATMSPLDKQVLSYDFANSRWDAADIPSASIKTDFWATNGQTIFSVTYTPGYVDVFIEGSLVEPNRYTALNGTTIALDSSVEADTWVQIVTSGLASSNALFQSATEFTATADQDTYVCAYNPKGVTVYSDGVKLRDTEYTATNGTSVVLDEPSTVGSWIQVISHNNLIGNFLSTSGKAADSDKLDGLDSTHFLSTSGKAADSDKLDGLDSTQFLRLDADSTKTAGKTIFNDNLNLSFGTGEDASFRCNGSHFYLDLQSGIGNFYIRDGTTTRFTFDDSGAFTATGNITAYSDRRLKKNIEIIPNAMDKILQLSGYTFDRKDVNTKRQTGVIAQEIEAVLPEAVIEDENGKLSVAYGNMVGLLIEGMKEQQATINALTKRIEELEK